MKRYIAVFFLSLVFLCVGHGAISGEELPVLDYIDKMPNELESLHPTLKTTKPEQNVTISEQRGWKEIAFSFNAKGRLISMTFVPKIALSESDAIRIIKDKLKFDLPERFCVRAPAVIAYRDMPGPIKTVNLLFVDIRTDRRISEIGVFSARGWRD